MIWKDRFWICCWQNVKETEEKVDTNSEWDVELLTKQINYWASPVTVFFYINLVCMDPKRWEQTDVVSPQSKCCDDAVK